MIVQLDEKQLYDLVIKVYKDALDDSDKQSMETRQQSSAQIMVDTYWRNTHMYLIKGME